MTGFDNERKNVGPGWQPIIEQLHADLLEIDPDYRVDQIKEKFGGLRYYISSDGLENDEFKRMQDLIMMAEGAASGTCEECGQPGAIDGSQHWLRTLCVDCRSD